MSAGAGVGAHAGFSISSMLSVVSTSSEVSLLLLPPSSLKYCLSKRILYTYRKVSVLSYKISLRGRSANSLNSFRSIL